MMAEPLHVWQDGELIEWKKAGVHVSSLGFGFGLSVFEGIRAYWRNESRSFFVFRLGEHLKRLRLSSKIYRLEVPYSDSELADAVVTLLTTNGITDDTYIRIYVYPGNPWGSAATTNVSVFAVPRKSNLADENVRALRCNVSSWRRIPDDVVPPRAKMAGNYLQYALGEQESRAGNYDEPIMLTREGKVSEPPGANIFLIHGDQLITPSPTSSVLIGLTRDTVLRLTEEKIPDMAIVERSVDRTELYLADEVFICGTGHAEITPVGSVDGIDIGSGGLGPVTGQLRQLYSRAVHGLLPDYEEWVTQVAIGN